MPNYFIRGLIIGFSIAAPVGPIGVLVIHRTLINGRLSGLVSGLGAATADAIYGSIAGLGLTFVSSFLVKQQEYLSFFGGLFLCYLGVKTLLTKSISPLTEIDVNETINHSIDSKILTNSTYSNHNRRNNLAYYGSTLFLTLTNPMTILSFAAIFAGFGLPKNSGNLILAFSLIFGVFMGSALWWFFLSTFTNLFRVKASDPRILKWINGISGLIILGFGLAILISLDF